MSLPENQCIKSGYKMLKDLDCEGKKTWVMLTKGILLTYGFGEVWIWQGVGDEGLFD